ncbi:hypothetical protein [Corynebacterium aquatimens]|uniref:Uncharacterized protein n=1 Tax=Corynebacterium aquatimens TaxID=1190508 RepID=A0A931E371_9CORY|nr:hypothetical protein [Corynebacterium aquatimens]MBG6122961.1 hypothetical protein [Corynebacterium aquatimens]WJY66704.1 hypothetical protein CAQUA_10085 [Corynebacterium aquatimens]
MRIIHCACCDLSIPGTQRVALPPVPSRGDLRFLDSIAKELSLIDDTPSLTDLTSNPSAPYMAEPTFAPQKFSEPLRVIVSGSDAALSAVLTRMMRGDYLWAEVSFIPDVPSSQAPASPAAAVWGLEALSRDDAVDVALHGSVSPLPCIRTDKGEVIAGSATILGADGGPFIGEIIVDSGVLLSQPAPAEPGSTQGWLGRVKERRASARFAREAARGARIVPTQGAPGLAAATLLSMPASGTARGSEPRLRPDPATVLTGRAVQVGGPGFTVSVDGAGGASAARAIKTPKPQTAATFYRHLRDIQAVRPSN